MRGCKCNADQNVLLINNIRLNPFKNRVAFECKLWEIFQNNGHNPFKNRVTFERITGHGVTCDILSKSLREQGYV